MNIYDDIDFFNSYAAMPRSAEGLSAAGEWRQLRQMFPDLKNKSVLDLGCGYGWHCKYAADMGAKEVTGIDASERMLLKAREINADPAINYVVSDFNSFDYKKERYDFVISNLSLHYIEDILDIYNKVYYTLKNGGVFLLNIEHPVFTAGVKETWVTDGAGKPLYWPVDDYFRPGERETVFLGHKVKKYHHTLTQILGGLIKTGFTIADVQEAEPSHFVLKTMPEEIKRPMMLLVKAKKQLAQCL